jgi:hypothetical protein
MCDKEDNITAHLLKKWEISKTRPYPPNVPGLPKKLHHLRQFVIDMAYVNAPQQPMSLKLYRRQIYTILLVLEQIDKVTMPVRVVRKDPHIPWPRV